MWIVRTALKSPYAVAVMALLILVLGLVATANLPIEYLAGVQGPGRAGDDLFRGDADRVGREDDHQQDRAVDQSGDRLPADRIEIDAGGQRRAAFLSG